MQSTTVSNCHRFFACDICTEMLLFLYRVQFKFRNFDEIKDTPEGRPHSHSSSTPRSDVNKSSTPKTENAATPQAVPKPQPNPKPTPTPTPDPAPGISTSNRNRKQRHDDKPVHPYIFKFNAYERKVQQILGRMFDIANNDLLISNRDS